MKDDVTDAKLDSAKNSCSLENVEYLEDVTLYWSINPDGTARNELDHTDGDFVCYICRDCETEFYTFEELKEHTNGTQ